MNNQIIEQLAQKFQTTTEHLWEVLINQAAVSATVSLIWLIFCTGGIVAVYKFYKKESSKNELSDFPEFFFAVSFGVYVLLVLILTNDIVNGYFNPEYWALKHLLNG